MAVAIKLQIRQTTADAAVYVGPNGLLIVDTGYTSVRVHDGVTEGGNLLLSAKGNLRELTNPAAARAALQLGSAALLDADIGFMLGSNNLSELDDVAAARLNLQAAQSGDNTDITSLELPDLGLRQNNAMGDFGTRISFTGVITADRVFKVVTPDADVTLTMAANATISGVNTGDQATNLIGDVTSEISGTDVVVTLNDVVVGAVADNAKITYNNKGLITAKAERAQNFPSIGNGIIDFAGNITKQFYRVTVNADSGASVLTATITLLRSIPRAKILSRQVCCVNGTTAMETAASFHVFSSSSPDPMTDMGVAARRIDGGMMANDVEFWVEITHLTA